MDRGDTIIDFIKMSGAGNDFVLIDATDRTLRLDRSTLARMICDRHYGVGADGLLILEKHPEADFGMVYFNSDGSSGSMCGNGGRCAAAYVMNQRKLGSVNFYCCEYIYTARKVAPNIIKLSMKDCRDLKMKREVNVAGVPVPVYFIDTGAPHAVVLSEEIPPVARQLLESEGLDSFARGIRYSDHFAPGGANVDIVVFSEDGSVAMRTYEKGVEMETLACGTGALASAMIGSTLRKLQPPVTIIPKSGEKLQVSFGREGERFVNVELEGPADVIFRGQYAAPTELVE